MCSFVVDTTGTEPAYRCNRGITTGRSVFGKRAPASNPYAEQSPASSTIPSRSLRQRPVLFGPPSQTVLGGGIRLPTCPQNWCAARDSNAEASRFELPRYAVPVSCAWCGPPESNRDASGFKPPRYSCSLQIRKVGSRPRTRTEKHLFLRQVGMPNSLQTAIVTGTLGRTRTCSTRGRSSVLLIH
jgi:hypothetical protein